MQAAISNPKVATNTESKQTKLFEPGIIKYKCKRRLDKIETECIYRAVETLCYNLSELRVLQEYIGNDALIFAVTDIELREHLIRHQMLLNKMSTNFIDYNDIVGKVKFSTQTILRYLLKNGLSLVSMIQGKKAVSQTPLEKILRELREVMLDKLLTDADDEHLRNKYVLDVMQDTRKSHVIINQLTDTLNEKITEREHWLNEKDLFIRQLKGRLDQMIANTCDEQNMCLKDASKQIFADQKSLENKQNKLGQDILCINETLRKHRKENHGNEAKLRKRKFKMAGELFNWIGKYDQDLGWRQEQIDEIEMLHKQDLEEISQLEFHFDQLMIEYNAIMEERRLKEEAKVKEQEMQALKRRAIVKIQAVYRGWLSRENVKRNGKKGGKKGGKKDGKKK